jgi:cell division septum initiation protein DivIVA
MNTAGSLNPVLRASLREFGGRAVADGRVKGRVKGLLGGASAEDTPVDPTPTPMPMPSWADPDAQRQALQVLTLAQRTADEHVASVQQQANSIRAGARAAADQIAQEAQAHAEAIRREAAKKIADAQATAEKIVKDAQAHGDGIRRDAAKALADARATAASIVKDSQAAATGLERDAQQQYDNVVGTLETKRAALQEQIEALQTFDGDYRSRLRTFMTGQLQALGDEGAPPPVAPVQPSSPRVATSGVQRMPDQ